MPCWTIPFWRNGLRSRISAICRTMSASAMPRSWHRSTGMTLAAALRSHHVYVTGSLCEPAGMHHIEGASCGLPVLYRKSGALPEYCADFGEGFDGPDLPGALRRLAGAYHVWADRVLTYPYSADRMCGRYLDLFATLLSAGKPPCSCAAGGGMMDAMTAMRGERLPMRTWVQNAVDDLPRFIDRLRVSGHRGTISPRNRGVLADGRSDRSRVYGPRREAACPPRNVGTDDGKRAAGACGSDPLVSDRRRVAGELLGQRRIRGPSTGRLARPEHIALRRVRCNR